MKTIFRCEVKKIDNGYLWELEIFDEKRGGYHAGIASTRSAAFIAVFALLEKKSLK